MDQGEIMHDHATKFVEQQTPATNPDQFWLQSYITPDTDNMVRIMERHAQVAAAFALDAPGCEEAAIEVVLFAQSQIEFLQQFGLNGFARDSHLSAKTLVELKLSVAADVLELKRLNDFVAGKAPASKLAREIKWALEHSLTMLHCLDRVIEEANRG